MAKRDAIYPVGSVRALLRTELLTPATRSVIEARLQPAEETAPQFFSLDEFGALTAACIRLLPADSPLTGKQAAQAIDTRLAEGHCDGWRYDSLPPDGDAYRKGLRALDASARLEGVECFAALSSERQDAFVTTVARAESSGEAWKTFDAKRFFEELLAEISECYMSDPLVQEQIGYAGMADAAGWQRIGLDEREVWEPAERENSFSTPAALPPLAKPRDHAEPVMRHWSESEIVDVVVIGTGAGGGPLLARLAQAGLKIVALEAGKFCNPARDFATDERAQRDLFWNDERLSAGRDPIAFGNNNSGIGVGGSTLHYTAYTPRPQPDDFRLHSEFGVGVDWPIGYEELEPYYDELEAFLGVSGPTPYPWGPPRRRGYALAPLPLNSAAQLMQRACRKLGIRTSAAPNAALSAPYYQPAVGWRPACTNRGFCQAGCSTGAKASVDVTFIPVALQAGAEIRTETFATQIERDSSDRVCGVVYVHDGQDRRQRCRNVFLCAGAIETPRLLLMNGIANGSGQVGRNFMAHTGAQIWARFDEETRPFKGIPGGLISEDTHRPADADFAGGYLLQSIGVMPVTYASQLARSGRGLFGDPLGEHLRGYNHVAGINILGECLPSPENFLELSDEPDVRRLPKPRIHFSAGENERRLTAHANRLMREIWEEAGGRKLWGFPRFAHIIGTCRMGCDPESAVVDSDGRCFGVEGLFICDHSIFPSALAANPALTIMALSLRTADQFLNDTGRTKT